MHYVLVVAIRNYVTVEWIDDDLRLQTQHIQSTKGVYTLSNIFELEVPSLIRISIHQETQHETVDKCFHG